MGQRTQVTSVSDGTLHPGASRDPGSSVLPRKGLNSANDMNEPGSGFSLRPSRQEPSLATTSVSAS